MKFTDEDGKEYEALNLKGAVIPVKADGEQAGDTYLIRPIQPKPKWKVFDDQISDTEWWLNIDLQNMSKDQAQRIKAWISAGMEFITSDLKYLESLTLAQDEVDSKMLKARQSLKEDK